jgi:hypothetical protein
MAHLDTGGTGDRPGVDPGHAEGDSGRGSERPQRADHPARVPGHGSVCSTLCKRGPASAALDFKKHHTLEADPSIVEAPAGEIAKIQKPETPVSPLPETAGRISGKTYQLIADPAMGLPQRATFTFPGGDTYQVEFVVGSEVLEITGGLNNLFFYNTLGTRLAAFRGRWLDERTFVEEQYWDLYSELEALIVTYAFEGETVDIRIDSSMGYFPTLQVAGERVE